MLPKFPRISTASVVAARACSGRFTASRVRSGDLLPRACVPCVGCSFAGLFYPKNSFVCANFDKCCQLCQYLADYDAPFAIIVQSSELASDVSYGVLWLIVLAPPCALWCTHRLHPGSGASAV